MSTDGPDPTLNFQTQRCDGCGRHVLFVHEISSKALGVKLLRCSHCVTAMGGGASAGEVK